MLLRKKVASTLEALGLKDSHIYESVCLNFSLCVNIMQ